MGSYSTEAEAQRIQAALQGKSYMNFHVDYGILPGPYYQVSISTEHEGSKGQILGMALFCLSIEYLKEKA